MPDRARTKAQAWSFLTIGGKAEALGAGMRTFGNFLRLLILVLILGGHAANAATRLDLNGAWRFRTDPNGEGLSAGWGAAPPDGARTVTVPHTWNLGQDQAFDGVGWYFKKTVLPEGLAGRHVELNFGGTFYKSRVFVNGVEAGGHEGGFTAYHLDVSKLVRTR
jgi:beta-glucuronidase